MDIIDMYYIVKKISSLEKKEKKEEKEKKPKDSIKSGYYKLYGIKTLSETVENIENYVVIKRLKVKEAFKEAGKSLFGLMVGVANNSTTNKTTIICDKIGNEQYYIKTEQLNYTAKASVERIELYCGEKILGYVNVKKDLVGIFTKKERCRATVYIGKEKIAEFEKYDSSTSIDANSEDWDIDVDKTRGGFNIRYKKEDEGLSKKEKTNVIKWRQVQPEKEEKYVTESVIIFGNREDEIFKILLVLGAQYADIPTKIEDET